MLHTLPLWHIERTLNYLKPKEREASCLVSKEIERIIQRINSNNIHEKQIHLVKNKNHILSLSINTTNNIKSIFNLRELEYDELNNEMEEEKCFQLIKFINDNVKLDRVCLQHMDSNNLNQMLENIKNIRSIQILQDKCNNQLINSLKLHFNNLRELDINTIFNYDQIYTLFNTNFLHLIKLKLVLQSQPIVNILINDVKDPFFQCKLQPANLPNLIELNISSEQLEYDYEYITQHTMNTSHFQQVCNVEYIPKLNICLPIDQVFHNIEKVKFQPLDKDNIVILNQYFPKCKSIELIPYSHLLPNLQAIHLNQFKHLTHLELYTKHTEFDTLFTEELNLPILKSLKLTGPLINDVFFKFLFEDAYLALPNLNFLFLSHFEYHDTALNIHPLKSVYRIQLDNYVASLPYFYQLLPNVKIWSL